MANRAQILHHKIFVCVCVYIYIYMCICMYVCMYVYTVKMINAFVFAPIFLKDRRLFICTQKAYFSQILFTNLSKSVLVSTSPLLR